MPPRRVRTKSRTSMWLSPEVLRASTKRARELGISRTVYFDQLLRKDLGLKVAVEMEQETANEQSVFG